MAAPKRIKKSDLEPMCILTVHMPEALREKIREKAAKDDRPMTSWINKVLTKAVEEGE